jgi:lysine 2,3-aminomutase
VLPQRVTDNLCNLIKKYHPVWLNTHFNHPHEITKESTQACEKLANVGIPLGNQSVLLRGVNDSIYTMKKLVHELVKIRVRPYYVYQCDLSTGLVDFRTTVSKGIDIMEGLRGHTSGFCVPTFIVDAPGGGGKIPVMPNYVVSQSEKSVVLRNYEGVICRYDEPEDYTQGIVNDEYKEEYNHLIGVAGLIHNKGKHGKNITIEPADLERHKRNIKKD